MRNILAVMFLLVISSPVLMADQIALKNGDHLTGSVVKSDAKTLVLKTDYAGDVTIQWAAITGIDSTQALHLGLAGGQTIVGPVTTTNATIAVVTKSAGTVTTSKDSIQAIRNDAEQAAYDAQIDRLMHPHLLDFWSGFIDSGLSTTKGNSDTLSFTLGARAVRTTESDKITVYSNSVFSTNSTSGSSVTTAHSIIGGIRGDFNLSPRAFVFGTGDFQYDQFQMLNLRSVLGGGFGYHAIQSKAVTFDLYGGGAYDQAFYYTQTIKSGEIDAGETFAYKLSSRASLTEELDLFPNISTLGQYRFNFTTSAVTKVNTWLNWQISFQDRYVSDPIPGIKKNDLLLTTGVRLTFGKGNL